MSGIVKNSKGLTKNQSSHHGDIVRAKDGDKSSGIHKQKRDKDMEEDSDQSIGSEDDDSDDMVSDNESRMNKYTRPSTTVAQAKRVTIQSNTYDSASYKNEKGKSFKGSSSSDAKMDHSFSLDISQDVRGYDGEDESGKETSIIKKRKRDEAASLIDPYQKSLDGFQCDYCGKENLTERWRCLDCEDFDACDDCYKACKHDPLHGFVFLSGSEVKLKNDASIDGFYATRAVRKQNSLPFKSQTSRDGSIYSQSQNEGSYEHKISTSSSSSQQRALKQSPKGSITLDEAAISRVKSILSVNGIIGIQVSDDIVPTFIVFYDTFMQSFRSGLQIAHTATQLPSPPLKGDPAGVINRSDFRLACLLSLVLSGISLSDIEPLLSTSVTAASENETPAYIAVKALFEDDQNEIYSKNSFKKYSSSRHKLPATLLGILDQLRICDEHNWFSNPVPASNVEYHKKIQKPSDFKTTKDRLIAGDFNDKVSDWYSGPAAAITTMIRRFRRTIRRVWYNATVYHEAKSAASEEAAALAIVFSKMMELTCIRFGINYTDMLGTEELENGEPATSIMQRGKKKILSKGKRVEPSAEDLEQEIITTEKPIQKKKKSRDSRSDAEDDFVNEVTPLQAKKAKKDPSKDNSTPLSVSNKVENTSEDRTKSNKSNGHDSRNKNSNSQATHVAPPTLSSSSSAHPQLEISKKQLNDLEEKFSKEQSKLHEELKQLRSDLQSLKQTVEVVVKSLKVFGSSVTNQLDRS